jgi:hypothetical protein
MNSRNAVVCALLAAAGSTAPAGVFTWTGGVSGDWEDPANWSGPGGLYPRLTVDSATVSGHSETALLNSNVSLGLLNVLNGATVDTFNNRLFIDGDANIIGNGSVLTVTDSASLRDLDVDSLRIDGGILGMFGGIAQIDERVQVGGPNGGAIFGVGTVEMNSTTGDLEIVGQGGLWALGGGGDNPTLLIDRTDSSTSRLDWSHPDGSVVVWDGKTVHSRIPYTGALGGRISVSNSTGSSRFLSDEGFIATPSSLLAFSGTDDAYTARIEAPFVDSYGELSVSGRGRLEAMFVGLRGSGEIAEGALLVIDTPAMLWDSFSLAATGPNASVLFTEPNAAISVTGGATVFELGETGTFDLDGAGNMEISIADGSSLEILAGEIDTGAEIFGGTLNIAGDLHIESYGWPQLGWVADGDINMQGGEITGRRFISDGTISGRGVIDTTVHNDGIVEAIGGTLQFLDLDLDGTPDYSGNGTTRAEQGDIVVTRNDLGGFLPTAGSLFVGDGNGPREVFEMNGGIALYENTQGAGLVSLNGGFARFGRARMESQFESMNDSVVTISGSGEHDGLEFVGGTATLGGVLEVRGNSFVWEDAQLSGGGTLYGASTVKRVALMDGSSTGDVAIDVAGAFELGAYGQNAAQASAAALTMRPTASFGVDLAGTAASGEFDAVQIAGDASVDGTLVVRWSADLGDAPVGQTYTVLTADSVAGSFDGVDFSDLGTNRRAHVTINPDSVEVLVTCLTDLNADGVLDLADINTFVDSFTSADMLADVAPPLGVLDLNDINAFVFFFQGGCN